MSRRRWMGGLLGCILVAATACTSAGSAAPSTSDPPIRPSSSSSSLLALPTVSTSQRPTSSRVPASTSKHPTTSAAAPTTSSRAVPPPPPSSGAPVIVIDPGHSVSVSGTDAATGLNTSDYENEPEMGDVFAVALLVRRTLTDAGYQVYLTKTSVDEPMNLGERAYLANRLHASLALSIHDQAGANGGLPFDSANNNVYYQADGDYRVNPAGHHVVFDNPPVAALSEKYGEIFQQQRQAVEHHPVRLLSNTGYDLGSRGLQAGDIWIVQLLSHVPWIYNEAGGNSAGMVGLSDADERTYAAGLVAGVEHCIPPPH